MTLSLFEWSFFNNTVFMGIKIAAAAKAVAATIEEIAGAIAAGGWVALVILAVIIIILLIIMATFGHWEYTFPHFDTGRVMT